MNDERNLKRKPSPFRWLWLSIPAGALILIARFAFVATQSHSVGLGQEMMADDFGFTVIAVERLTKISNSEKSIEPSGQFLVVELQVANHAKRVDFRFDPNIVLVEDELGQRYRMTTRAQESIDSYGSAINTLAAGETERRKIVFDVPREVLQPKIRIAFGGRIGEVVDYLLYGNRWFEIPTVKL